MRKIKDLPYNNFCELQKAAKQIAKEWDRNTIPLTLANQLIDKIKINPKDAEFNDFKEIYNDLLEVIKTTISNQCKKMKTDIISVKGFCEIIEVVKEGYLKGKKK